MKNLFLLLIILFDVQIILGQCDCQKINRPDGVVVQCNPLPIGGDQNLQVGLSLASNRTGKYITVTIRYISGPSLKINGDLSLRLSDNNLITFELVNTQSSYIGNSEVENAIFHINENQLNAIKYSNLLTLSIMLSDSRIHTIEATLNKKVLMNQVNCL